MRNEDFYTKAQKNVKAKKGFLSHLIAYAGVIGLLYAIMHFENNGEILPVIIVALSWGIGLAGHYFKTFGTEHLDFLGISSNWEEEELEKEIAKLKRKRELREGIQRERDLLDKSERLELKEIELKEVQKRPLNDDLV